MSSLSPNRKIKLYNSTTDSQSKFLTFRTDINGEQEQSAIMILDKWSGTVDRDMTELKNRQPSVLINATWISTGYYEATKTEIADYRDDMMMTFRPNQDSDGTTTLKINDLDVKTLMKYDHLGEVKNLDAKDLRKNHEYQFRYDGTRWIWQIGTSSDQVNIVGTSGDVISISDDGTIVDSGIKSEQININKSNIGNITALTTTDKTSTVAAINENVSKIDVLLNELGVPYATWLDNPDYNTLITFNRYRVGGGTHSPDSNTVFYLEVNPVQDGIIYQKATGVYGNNVGVTFERVLKDNAWTDWKEVATTDNAVFKGSDMKLIFDSARFRFVSADGKAYLQAGTATSNLGDMVICGYNLDRLNTLDILSASCTVNGKEVATTDKIDISFTPATGYVLSNQRGYEGSLGYNISFEVRKADGGVFNTGFHYIANAPSSMNFLSNVSLSVTCLDADGAPLPGCGGVLEYWGTKRALLHISDPNTKIIIINSGTIRKG